ncbi:hypothetical protein BT69DRAFT_1340945, partial [Atractiella rhizophila]
GSTASTRSLSRHLAVDHADEAKSLKKKSSAGSSGSAEVSTPPSVSAGDNTERESEGEEMKRRASREEVDGSVQPGAQMIAQDVPQSLISPSLSIPVQPQEAMEGIEQSHHPEASTSTTPSPSPIPTPSATPPTTPEPPFKRQRTARALPNDGRRSTWFGGWNKGVVDAGATGAKGKGKERATP